MARPEENSATGALAAAADGGLSWYRLRITQNIKNRNVRMPAEFPSFKPKLRDLAVDSVWSILVSLACCAERKGGAGVCLHR